MTRVLTRQAILDAQDMALSDPVDVPEWGGVVYLRPMTAGEKDDYESWAFDLARKKAPHLAGQLRARLVAICVCDENGERIFTDEDAPELARKNNVPVSRITDAIARLNRLDPKERKQLAKN